MKLAFKICLLVFFCICSFSALSAKAITISNPLKYESFEELAEHIANIFVVIAVSFVGLAVVVGAFFILTSGGDPSRWQKGRDIILYALLGLTIIILARGIISFIKYIFGAEEESSFKKGSKVASIDYRLEGIFSRGRYLVVDCDKKE